MNSVPAGWRLGILALAATAVVANAPAGRAETHVVSTVSELNYWSVYCDPGDEIVINPGLYVMNRRLYMSNKAGLTIRGATGNAEDVILRGPGMNNPNTSLYEAFDFASPDMTLADLTIEEYYHHAIHFQTVGDRCLADNVRTLNIGCQHIKGAQYNDDCVIRNCLMQQTKVRENGLPDRLDNYIGGIDLHGARRVHIYDNVAIDINGLHGGDGGIFIWNDSSDCIIERNVVIGCRKGIELGNPSSSVPTSSTIVRNNFVLRKAGNDIGLELCYTNDCQVYNNTVCSIAQDSNFFRTVHIYGTTSNLQLTNNLFYGNIRAWSGGETGWTSTNNIIGTAVSPSWFVDMAAGDLHLNQTALAAIDQALTLAEVTDDVDGHPRPVGDFPDVGADEYGSSAGPQLPTPPPAAPPAGVPYLDWAYQYAGDGLYGVTFTVRGNDGVAKSFFADASFGGADGGQIVQTKAIIIPGSLEYDVHSETDADAYDGMGTPPYDKDGDCWFGDAFIETPADVMVLTESENHYHVKSSTGAASAYADAKLAYICTNGNVSYAVSIGRLSESWPYAGTLVLPPPGDANYDGLVDGGDYTIWANCYSDTGLGWGGGDFNGDGVTDGGDYTIWADYYGTGGGAAIPEPATLVLLAASVVFACRRRR